MKVEFVSALGLMVGVIISIFFGVSVSSKLSIGFEGRGFFSGEIPTVGPLSAEYSSTDGLPLYDGELLSSIGSSPGIGFFRFPEKGECFNRGLRIPGLVSG